MVWREVDLVMADPRSTEDDTARVEAKLRSGRSLKLDRPLLCLLFAGWVAAVGLAFTGVPLALGGGLPLGNSVSTIAVLVGWSAVGSALVLHLLRINPVYFRVALAIGQAVLAALWAEVLGAGQMTYIASAAALLMISVYRVAWLVQITASALLINAIVRGWWWPDSGFGATDGSLGAGLAYACWVGASYSFCHLLVRLGQHDLRENASREARMDILYQTAVASESSARASFEQAAVGMCYASVSGAIIRVNSQFCETTGYSQLDLAGKRLSDITHAEDQ